MQVINQTRTAAMEYRGVALRTNAKGMTEISILSAGGHVGVMGTFQDYRLARSVVKEIIDTATSGMRNYYYIPAEPTEPAKKAKPAKPAE